MSDANKTTVLETNAAFYRAFKNFDEMKALWSFHGPWACLHPGQDALTERDVILQSWQDIIQNEQLDITPRNEAVQFFGDTLALVTCEEVIAGQQSPTVMVASNLYTVAYSETGWAVCVHHAGRKA